MYPRLSALTPAVVDRLYGIDTATPTETPQFVFLLGPPGIGKTSNHPSELAHGNYATINLDVLLENLRPFRIGSSLAWWAGEQRFTALPGYQTRRENAAALGWWEKGRLTPALNSLAEETIDANQTEKSIVSMTDAALARAIDKSINIVWETTVSLNKQRRVKKVDDVMSYLRRNAPHYTVLFVLIDAPAEELSQRLIARQSYNQPYRAEPFWRPVPTEETAVEHSLEAHREAFAALRAQYRAKARFKVIINRVDFDRLPISRNFNADEAEARILSAYRRQTRRSSGSRRRSGSSGSSGSKRKTTNSRNSRYKI